MEIPFIIKSFVVFGFLLVYNIEAKKYGSVVDLNDFNSLNNPQTIIAELQSTWSSWFRNTFIDNRTHPEYVVTKFKEDNTFMFVFDTFYLPSTDRDLLYVMILLDGDGKVVAKIHLYDPPRYTLYVHENSMLLDAFEDQYKENNYKSFDLHAQQLDTHFIDRKTKTLYEIKRLQKVCTVLSPIITLTSCDSSNDNNDSLLYADSDIDFCIITSLTDEKKIKYDNLEGLFNSKFNPRLKTIVVIHGFQVYPFTSGHDMIKSFQDAYFDASRSERVNLIGIDWTKAMPIDYVRASYRVETIGRVVGEFIYLAIQNQFMHPEDIYLVGHSLGAHVAGFIGKTLHSLSKQTISAQKITAMDPAGPLYSSTECTKRVCESDADWVEILHSNGGVLGLYKQVGKCDFYLNGGSYQPGCGKFNPVCSHSYSHRFYRKMLTLDATHQEFINGWLCRDLVQLQNEKQCQFPRNPRHYFSKFTLHELGPVYIPYPAIDGLTDESNVTRKMTTTTNEPKTIVLFGANRNNEDLLAGLLSDDNNLYVLKRENSYIVYNPKDNQWKPLDKYHINIERQPDAITSYLNTLPKPMKFVLTVDYTDLFGELFWTLLKFIAQDSTHHNELVVVAMNIPNDDVPLQQHIDELKGIIQNSDAMDQLGPFEIRGIHEIQHSGKIAEIPKLSHELAAIKLPVGF